LGGSGAGSDTAGCFSESLSIGEFIAVCAADRWWDSNSDNYAASVYAA